MLRRLLVCTSTKMEWGTYSCGQSSLFCWPQKAQGLALTSTGLNKCCNQTICKIWLMAFALRVWEIEIIDKSQSHGQNKAQRLRYNILWQILTWHKQLFLLYSFVYVIYIKCHIWNSSSFFFICWWGKQNFVEVHIFKRLEIEEEEKIPLNQPLGRFSL